MAKNNNLGDFLKSLADKFRSVMGTSDKINPQDFESKVDGVYTKGFNEGGNAGYEQGYLAGENAGIEHGKQIAYDTFWDTFQKNGNRTEYEYAFAWGGWTAETFKPKYDLTLKLGNCGNIFAYANIEGSLKTILNECGVTLTFFQQNGRQSEAQYIFVGTKFTELPVIDVSQAKGSKAIQSLFSGSTLIQTIEKLVMPTDCTGYGTDTFNRCYALENIDFGGTIKYSLSFEHCPLSATSFYNVKNHLDQASYSGERSITFKSDIREKVLDYEQIDSGYWDWLVSDIAQYDWTIVLV